ncbi:cytochrome c3 family protein [Sphingomonas sp. LY54]|uniref:cytochrome c3 family protein n=1 Tax=Sphingomonas sp. LY54 TaxID=3095343 RepID=UPI002D78A6CF|nr:cytochrome c3 family protein [Sphingomonas sp. LY54]WRP28426.1 cytochrome c3 family protein [Sphingomonas sp. LY54]
MSGAMAFLLRLVSRSAAGREIVRTSRIETDRLDIGRDPASHVRLSDLAAALHHATIERTSPGQLSVTAGEGLYVELDGRKKVRSGTIELPAGGDIRIGSHLLRVMPAAIGAEEVAIVMEKVPVGEADRRPDADRLFSLSAVMPGKRKTAWIGALAVLALFLAWPVWSYYQQRQDREAARFHADSMWTPGALSTAHAGLEKDCQACHVKPFEAVRDDSCTACHTQVHDHAEPFRLARAQPDLGTRGRVELAFKETFGIPPGRCVECHVEHEGAQKMPVTAQRFCSDCHADLKAKLPDTKLPDAGDFGTAHPQFRPAVLTDWRGDRPVIRRVSLDAEPREDSGLKFPHAMHLSTTNGVAQMARRLGRDYGFGQALDCKDCHDPTPDGVRFQPVTMEEDCAMCHSLAFDRVDGTVRTLRHGAPGQVVADLRDFYRARAPSPPATLGGMSRRRPGDVPQAQARGRFASGTIAPGRAERAIRAVFSPGGACFDCHGVDAPPRGSLAFGIRPVAFPLRYMHKGWFDHKAHETQSCSSCHAAGRSNSATDLLLPDLKSCRTCHGGESSATEVPSGCAMCHDYHMDEGAPAMLVRQRVRGKKKDTNVASIGARN